MAKKRDPFQVDFNIDEDWNLSAFDKFDSELDDGSFTATPKDANNSRKPIEKTGKIITAGLKGTTLGAAEQLKREIARQMPHTSRVADEAMNILSEGARLKNEIGRDISSSVNQAKQLAKILGPKLKGLSSNLAKKVEDWGDTAPSQYDNRRDAQQERDDFVQSAIGNIFKVQVAQTEEIQQEERIQRTVSRKLDELRHKDTAGLLNSILKENEFHTNFLKGPFTAYLSKSLEVQYKHMFISQDILSANQLFARMMEEKMNTMIFNSALPDIQKQKLRESYKDHLRGKLSERASSIMGNMIGGTIKNVGTNIKNNISSGLQNANMMMQMSASGIEQADGMRQMMEDMGMQMPSASETGANIGGGILGQLLMSKYGRKYVEKFAPYMAEPEKMFKNSQYKAHAWVKKQQSETDYFDSPIKSMLLNLINTTGGKGKVENTLLTNPTQDVPFDVATRTSIVEIIPSYLSKILQQVTMFNTGKPVAEQIYDVHSRDFVSADKMKDKFDSVLHGDKTSRHRNFAEGFSALRGGIAHTATDASAMKRQITTLDSAQGDISLVISNMAKNHYDVDVERIRQYVNGQVDDKDEYISNVFKGVKNSQSIAGIMLASMTLPSGAVNKSVKNSFLQAVINQSNEDGYLDKLPTLVNVFGYGRHLKDHFTEDFTIDSDKISAAQRDYSNKEFTNTANFYSRYNKNILDRDVRDKQNVNKDDLRITDGGNWLSRLDNSISNKIDSTKIPKAVLNWLENFTGNQSDMVLNDFVLSDMAYSESDVSDTTDTDIVGTGRKRKRRKTNPFLGSNVNRGNISELLPTTTNNALSSNELSIISTTGPNVVVDAIKEHCDKTIVNRQPVEPSTPHTINGTNITDLLQQIVDHTKSFSIDFSGYKSMMAIQMSEASAFSMAQLETLKSMLTGEIPKGGGAWKSVSNIAGKTATGLGGFIKDYSMGMLKLAGKGMSIGGDVGKSLIGGGLDLAKNVVSPLGQSLIGNTFKLGMGSLKLMGGFGKGVGNILTGGKFGGYGSGQSNKYVDVYLKGGDGTPLVTKQDFLSGLFTKKDDGSLGTIAESSYGISAPLFDMKMNCRISDMHISQGLVDESGNDLSKAPAGSGINLLSKAVNGAGSIGKGIFNTGKKFADGILGGKDSLLYKSANMSMDAVKWVGKKGGQLFDKAFGLGDHGGSGVSKKTLETLVSDKLDIIIELLENGGKRKVVGDHDGDGDREGSYQDFMQKNENRKNKTKTSNKGIKAGLTQIINGDSDSGLLGNLFMLMGGSWLAKKWAVAKTAIGTGLGTIAKTLMSGGKGLLGIVGSVLGKGAMTGATAVMTGASTLNEAAKAGRLGTTAFKATEAALAATNAGKTALSSGKAILTAGKAAQVGKLGAMLTKAMSYFPAKYTSKLGNIASKASSIASKLGPKFLGKILLRFATGPIGWVIWGGSCVYEAAKGMANASEIMGLPPEIELSLGDKIIVGIASTIAEGLCLGLLDTKWLAGLLGVNIDSYVQKAAKENAEDKTSDPNDPAYNLNDSTGGTGTPRQYDAFNPTANAPLSPEDMSKYTDSLGYTPPVNGTKPGTGSANAAVDPGTSFKSTLNQDKLDIIQQGGQKYIKPGAGGLGDQVAQFESGSSGSLAIGYDKTGGTSYGKYQIASAQGAMDEFITFCANNGGTAGKEIARRMQAAKPWNTGGRSGKAVDAWRSCVKDGLFGDLERQYIKSRTYDRYMNNFSPELSQAIQGSKALQEMLWSTSVQHFGHTGKIFNNAWAASKGDLPKFVEAVYADRATRFPSSTPEVQASVKGRFVREQSLVLAMLKNEGIDKTSAVPTGDGSATLVDGVKAGDGTTPIPPGSERSPEAVIKSGMTPNNTPMMSSSHSSSSAGTGAVSASTGSGMSASHSSATGSATGISAEDVKSGFGKLKTESGVDIDGIDPALKQALGAANAEFTEKFKRPFTITSGKRSLEKQQELYDKYGPSRAARPSPTAPHIRGIAIDMNSSDANDADSSGIFAKYGLNRPLWPNGRGRVKPEAWHVQLASAGIGNTPDDALKEDSAKDQTLAVTNSGDTTATSSTSNASTEVPSGNVATNTTSGVTTPFGTSGSSLNSEIGGVTPITSTSNNMATTATDRSGDIVLTLGETNKLLQSLITNTDVLKNINDGIKGISTGGTDTSGSGNSTATTAGSQSSQKVHTPKQATYQALPVDMSNNHSSYSIRG